MKIYLVLVLLAIISCSFDSGPEKALKNFINYSISDDQERSYYMENTTGNMLSFYNKLNDEEFEEVKKTGIERIKRIEINLSKCSETNCSITYTLKYTKDKGSENEADSEVRKIAELEKQEGIWKIADVLNIKTYIEAKVPLNP
ncbi:MAG: hypothetical protein OEY33_07640 [Bdellovibrionales bacterium]|jgi:hypothetical protein|nr:hypothetical protein [Bdellovibrionales bacterium]